MNNSSFINDYIANSIIYKYFSFVNNNKLVPIIDIQINSNYRSVMLDILTSCYIVKGPCTF